MIVNLSWAELKNLEQIKKLGLQYIDEGTDYKIWISENGDTYQTFISKTDTPNSDQIDFETNYKSISNSKRKSVSPGFYAEQYKNVSLYERKTNLTNDDFSEIISITPETGKVFYITDILFTATEDGELKTTINGYEVGYAYYGKRQLFKLEKGTPFVLPGGYTLSVSFKPDISGAKATVNFGGYKI